MCGQPEFSPPPRSRLANIVAFIVITVWAINIIVDAFSASYQPSPLIHFVLLAVVGAIFGSGLFERKQTGGKK